MVAKLISTIRGSLAFTLYVLNSMVCGLPIHFFTIFKLLSPSRRVKHFWDRLMAEFAWFWNDVSILIENLLLNIEWDFTPPEGLDSKKTYLIIGNHRTWTDILVVQRFYHRRVPLIRYFLKQELIWVPFVGLSVWGLEFPFLKRYSPEAIQKNPALKGKDLKTIRQFCEKFRGRPISIIIFLEGTRFTEAKYRRQNPPYRHLLKPKPGGIAQVLAVLGSQIEAILDTTIVYWPTKPTLWDFLSGKVRRVHVRMRKLEVPREAIDNRMENDLENRQWFEEWLHRLWMEKDELIDQLLQQDRAELGEPDTSGDS